MIEGKGITWPGWETVQCIGRGGFGTVYKIQRQLGNKTEQAALKVITIPEDQREIDEMVDEGISVDNITTHFEKCRDEILNEYSIILDLKGHSNVVYCEDVQTIQHSDGIGWDILIKMELLMPLTKYMNLKNGSAMSSADSEYYDAIVTRLGKDICQALAYCRRHNIIHRDIKPQNIFVSQSGTFKLGDFGIAKITDKTSSGTKNGTPEYMSPEIYHVQNHSFDTDIYSLGLVMYWMLNEHRTPFQSLGIPVLSANEKETAWDRRLNGEPIPLPVRGECALQAVILKACAYDRKDRYHSAEEMLNALNSLVFTPTPSTPNPPEAIDLDVHKTVTFDADDHPAGRTIAVNLGTETVYVQIPVSIKNGDTLPFSGKGRYDSHTRQRGNLYLTVEIKSNPQSIPSPENKIGIKPAVVAVGAAVALFLMLFNGISGDNDTGSASSQIPSVTPPINVQNVQTESTQQPEPTESAQERFKQETLSSAENLATDGKYRKAIALLWEAQNTYNLQDFAEKAAEYMTRMATNTQLAVGREHTVRLYSNGTVTAVGRNVEGQTDVSSWTNIKAIVCGDHFTLGLKEDGRVVAVGKNDEGQREADGWANVKLIAAGDLHSVGLTNDGYLLTAGRNKCGQRNISWLYRDIEIVSVAAGYEHTVVLYADGTVAAAGDNTYGQLNVSHWTDIVAIYAGTYHTVGLKADGTVVATGGYAGKGTLDISGWKNVDFLATGDYFTVGVTATGSVLFCGEQADGQNDAADWTDIKVIAGGKHHVVGIRSNGTWVTAGDGPLGQCDIGAL